MQSITRMILPALVLFIVSACGGSGDHGHSHEDGNDHHSHEEAGHGHEQHGHEQEEFNVQDTTG